MTTYYGEVDYYRKRLGGSPEGRDRYVAALSMIDVASGDEDGGTDAEKVARVRAVLTALDQVR